ncbi:MAG: hypothetical protein ACI8SJ_000866 [Shewanella sp.]|jgi:hypothetical protein
MNWLPLANKKPSNNAGLVILQVSILTLLYYIGSRTGYRHPNHHPNLESHFAVAAELDAVEVLQALPEA